MNTSNYPVGADTSDAPWNQPDMSEREVEVCISVTLSKTVKIFVDDYEFIEDEGHIIPDFSNCDLKKAVEEQVTLPQNLAEFTERMFNHDADLKAAKMPKYLKDAIKDCSDWNIDDFEVIEE